LGFQTDDRYRTVSEARILDMCHLAGWACEIGEGSTGRALTRRALESWIDLGMGFRRSADGSRYFDPGEVLNFLKQAGLNGLESFWTERMVGTARRLVGEMRSDTPGKFAVELRRTFNTQSRPAGGSLRLRMPLPLTSEYLGNLQVNPFTDAAEARIAVSRGRLEVRTQSSGRREVTIGAHMSFTGHAQQPSLQASQREIDNLYLRPRDGMIVVSDRVAALAKSLSGPAADPREVLRTFWNFCLDEFSQGAVHYDQVNMEAPGDWLLDFRWGDCRLISALFASMCRARGIPARILGGFYLYRACPTNHFWVEAWIDGQGWTPFDFICWELSGGGRDPAWRDYFFGRIDCRLTCECLPLDFTGAVGVTIPSAWHIVQSATRDGVSIDLLDINGTLLYRDSICVADQARLPS
jgi:transglutaminase-like putative cysteine protease